MFKKLLIGGVVITALALVVAGPSALSHVKQFVRWAKTSVEETVPLEYELERAEVMIEDIVPQIEDAKRAVAVEQVAIRHLRRDIAQLERTQLRDAERIKSRAEALKTGQVAYPVAGVRYSRESLDRELRLALKQHQQNATVLQSKERLLAAQTQALSAAQHQLQTVAAEKNELQVKVQHLRAKLREAQALEASRKRFQLDDGALANASKLLERLERRIDVASQMVENDVGGLVSITPTGTELLPIDVTAEVDRYFNQGGAEPAQVLPLRKAEECPGR